MSPFLRDKLFTSIYKSVQHRPSSLDDAIGLTNTVISSVHKDIQDGSLSAHDLATSTLTVLKRFDQPAAISYQAFHTDIL